MRKLVIAGGVVVLLVIALGAIQLTRTVPGQTVTLVQLSAATVPGSSALPWPSQGQGAVAVGATGGVRTSGTETPAPIASLAKMMTAYVVLKDHPITPGGSGGSIAIDTTEVATYEADKAATDSVLAVEAGETLTEQQALEGLLVPSADNVADVLADWDAGSVAAFVAKMNETAKALGMTQTTYTDPSGVTSKTVSTAADQLTIERAAMALDDFASIVALPTVTLPVAGKVLNYDFDIGHTGVIGVKTGSESASGGCWAFAAKRTVAGVTQTVYGVVLGIPAATTGFIGPALKAGMALANAVPGTMRTETVLPAGTVVGAVHAPWRATAVRVVTERAIGGLFLDGTSAGFHVHLVAPRDATVAPGTVLGSVSVSTFSGVVRTPAVVSGSGGGPSWWWRLTRG